MEIILANAVGRARRETLNGRAYLVAPVTSIVPGILNGSDGPGLYTAEENSRNPSAWNGLPIVLHHPIEDGRHVSARSPDISQKQELGRIFNSRSEAGRLRHDAWFDEELTRKRSPDTYAKLLAGEPIEVSTGLWTGKEPKNGTFNGKSYVWVARDYAPDHLAVLPGNKGACSVEDGCGVFNSNEQTGPAKKTKNEEDESEPTACECGGECDDCKEMAVNAGRYGNPQSKNSGKFKPHGAGTGKGEIHEAAQRGDLVLTEHDQQLGAEAKAELVATGKNPASWVADEAKWDRAKAAADKGRYSEDEYWAVVTHIYKSMGGEINKATMNSSKETIMPLSANERKALIDNVIANGCGCWQEEDRKTLNEFKDDRLQKLSAAATKGAEHEAVVNAVREAAPELTANAMPAFIKEKIKAKEDEEEAEGETENKKTKNKKSTKNITADECEGDDQDSECRAMFAALDAGGSTKNKKTGNSLAEWEASMPVEARAVWNSAKQLEASARGAAVARLKKVAEASSPKRRELILNKLKGSPDLTALQEMLAMVEADAPVSNYARPIYGTQDEVVANSADEILPIPPVINWEEEAAQSRKASRASASAV